MVAEQTYGLELRSLVMDYGVGAPAVDSIDLAVPAGQFVTLLGPSGCGKTTTLRMVAGLVQPTSGAVLIDGEDVTDRPAWGRDCGMVFQSYALFPHMTARQNIAYGLEVRGVGKADIAKKVTEVGRLVGIEPYLDRRPRDLSGGQQQRVAVARALAYDAKLVLMDEPLANLDAALRDRVRDELRELQRRIGCTVLYVTHDQGEAFALSDTVVVMRNGRIEQQGSPDEIYQSPATEFVASFIGGSNLINGKVLTADGDTATFASGALQLTGRMPSSIGGGAPAVAVVRVEDFQFGGADLAGTVKGIVRDVSYWGRHHRLLIASEVGELRAELPDERLAGHDVRPGSEIEIGIRKALILEPGE